MEMKKCTKCKIEKPATTEFFNRLRDGLQSHCKDCKKAYYNARKDEIANLKKEKYRKANPLPHTVELPPHMKLCSRCNLMKSKDNENFSKNPRTKDGFAFACKSCRNKHEYADNKQEVIKKRKIYYRNNSHKVAAQSKLYRERNRDKYLNYTKKYYENNKDKIKATSKKNIYKRIKTDPGFKIMMRSRTRIYKAVTNQGGVKSERTTDLIGCTVEELKQHLENQFTDGMSWDNYGEWHIDHIIPCASFDLTDEMQQRRCFHYSNLQPLWAAENISKSNKII